MGKLLQTVVTSWLALFWIATASGEVDARTAEVTAQDGVILKVTYYSPGKPGPGVLLLHQCNHDRKAWDTVARGLALKGIHVLTLDYRGYGKSAGERYLSLDPTQQAIAQAKWPGDIDEAFKYLLAQRGVDRTQIGAGGASCGVNNSIQLARRHKEVKTLVLLSGNTTADGLVFLQTASGLPLFVSASADDGEILPYMRWLMAFSSNAQNKLVPWKAAGHGTDMFAVEKGLEPMILDWFDRTLRERKVSEEPQAPVTRSPGSEFWSVLTQPRGVAQARVLLKDAKTRDPEIVLFPESAVNFLGYEHLQTGDTKGAVGILLLNELAYPRSPNVYDSLGDAYLADHQDDLALQYAEKTLKVLEENPPSNPDRTRAIRESAEGKIRRLKH